MDRALVERVAPDEAAAPMHVVDAASAPAVLQRLGPEAVACAVAQGFEGKAAQALRLPGGELAPALFGVGDLKGPPAAMTLRAAPAALRSGLYRIAETPEGFDDELAAVAFALGRRVFDRYKSKPAAPPPRLVVGDAGLCERALAVAEACSLARDMVDTPASDMGPAAIEALARDAATVFGARIEATVFLPWVKSTHWFTIHA